ncbi:MAG: serine protease [Planctomycetaceae bacterium]
MKISTFLVLALLGASVWGAAADSQGAPRAPATRAAAAPAASGPLEGMLAMAGWNEKPFVVVGNDGDEKGQGVLIRPDGYVLTAAHVTYDAKTKTHRGRISVSFRKKALSPWPGVFHRHTNTKVDAGPTDFFEEDYHSRLIKQGGRAQIDRADVALLKLETTAEALPCVDFYSQDKPTLRLGDRVYLCHYMFPLQKGDPTFLISPAEIIGAAETTMGVQYLAKGLARFGSSGAAILKDGKLIGIQSNAYTANCDLGEVPLGHFSFAPVWRGMAETRIAADKQADRKK